jgi:hypothetical protein
MIKLAILTIYMFWLAIIAIALMGLWLLDKLTDNPQNKTLKKFIEKYHLNSENWACGCGAFESYRLERLLGIFGLSVHASLIVSSNLLMIFGYLSSSKLPALTVSIVALFAASTILIYRYLKIVYVALLKDRAEQLYDYAISAFWQKVDKFAARLRP